MISAQKAKYFDATTMFTYSQAKESVKIPGLT